MIQIQSITADQCLALAHLRVKREHWHLVGHLLQPNFMSLTLTFTSSLINKMLILKEELGRTRVDSGNILCCILEAQLTSHWCTSVNAPAPGGPDGLSTPLMNSVREQDAALCRCGIQACWLHICSIVGHASRWGEEQVHMADPGQIGSYVQKRLHA